MFKTMTMAAVLVAAVSGMAQAEATRIDVTQDGFFGYAESVGFHNSYFGTLRCIPGLGNGMFFQTAGAIPTVEGYTIQVNSATLNVMLGRIWDWEYFGTTSQTLEVRGIAEAWDETVGATGNPGNAPSMFDTLISSYKLTRDDTGSFVAFDITSLVQGWANGTIANNGVGIINVGGDGYPAFQGKEDGLYANRPFFTIDYTLTPIPEPTTLMSIGAGAAMLLLKRRK